MFHPHRLIFRMPGVLTTDHLLQMAQSAADIPTTFEAVQPDQVDQLTKAKTMVVFIDSKNPESILEHPLLGPVLKPMEGHIFRTEKGKAGAPKKVLREEPVRVPIAGGALGAVEHVVLMKAATLEHSPEDDEFDVPRAWRDTVGKLKGALGDVLDDEDQSNEVYVFLDDFITQSPNAPHVARALGTALENLAYNTKHSKTPEEARSVDGAPPEDPASVDRYRESIRDRAMSAVHIVTSDPAARLDNLEKVFQMGDREGQMQLLCRFLSEASENSLDAEAMVRVLAKLHELIAEDFPFAKLTIYGNDDVDGLEINHDTSHMDLLKWVHQGSPEKGPFVVHLNWEHPEATGDERKVLVMKSMMFDSGGRQTKRNGGRDMQADMMAGAAGAGLLQRMRQDGANLKEKVDLVWAICSNRDDGNAREFGATLKLKDGPVIEEADPDAEGREAVAQALRKYFAIAHEKGWNPEDITPITMATLTGHSMVADGPMISVVSDQMAVRTGIEKLGRLNGEPVQTYRTIRTDGGSLDAPYGDLQNLPGPGPTGMRERGLVLGSSFIRRAAGMSEGMQRRHVHLDIASALDAWKKWTTSDVQGNMPAEGMHRMLWSLLSTPHGVDWVTHEEEQLRRAA